MPGLFFVFLALHLIAVVLAYGTTVVLPFIRTPGSPPSPRLDRLERLVTEKLALPAALSMPFTGAAMVIVTGINPTTQFWLWASIVLYLGTLAYLVIRQWPGVVSHISSLVDLDASARTHRALLRKRGVRSAADLLHLALLYGPGELS